MSQLLQNSKRPMAPRPRNTSGMLVRVVAAGMVGSVAIMSGRVAFAQAGPAAGAGAAAAAGAADQSVSAVKRPGGDQPGWVKKMAGSGVDLMNFVGSGTFYRDYNDAYVASALFLRPTYDLGTRFKLSGNARLAFEQEFTLPNNPTGRRFTLWDAWLWLSAKELHTFERTKLRVGGVARLVLPVSHESRYSNLIVGVAAGPSLNRVFELGSDTSPDRRWKLAVSVSETFTKNIHSSQLRGGDPGSDPGCRPFVPAGAVGGVPGAPSGAGSDRCGGPLNVSFSFMTTGAAVLSRGKWSGSMTLLVINSFRYDIPPDQFTAIGAENRGRFDSTWGIVSLSYTVNPHLSAGVGLSSFQPALDARNRYPRFPFFDLSGGANANNFTQLYLSVTGTL